MCVRVRRTQVYVQHACIRTSTSMQTWMYACIYIYAHIYAYIYIYIYIFARMYVRAFGGCTYPTVG